MKRQPEYNCRMENHMGFDISKLGDNAIGFDVIQNGIMIAYVSLSEKDARRFAIEILDKLGKE